MEEFCSGDFSGIVYAKNNEKTNIEIVKSAIYTLKRGIKRGENGENGVNIANITKYKYSYKTA